MPQFRAALALVAITAVVASCGGSASTPTSGPSTGLPPSPSLSTKPTSPPHASTAPSAAAAVASSVSLTEWKVVVTGSIKAGKTQLTINDVGVAAHEMLVFKSDRDPSAYPTAEAGNIKEEGAGVTLISDGENIDPGGTQTRTIDLAPGKYLFVCNIPGHFKQGMFTVVTVTK